MALLFSSKRHPAAIFSRAAGQAVASGPSIVLWSHTSSPYALMAADWNPSFETGLSEVAGTKVLTTDPKVPGSTAVEVFPDGEMGGIINSNDLNLAGQAPNGPMPLIPSWTPRKSITPFSDPAVGALTATVSLQVPYSEQPGQGSTVTSNQIVLYIGLKDVTTGRTLAYGLTLFDSRGSSEPYFGVDNGPGGTGAAVVTTPAGYASDLADIAPGSSSFQGSPWTGMQDFTLEITPQTLAAAIAKANEDLPSGGTQFSTNTANYALQNVSIDAETEYFGQQNSFSFSIGSFSVATSPSATSSLAPMASSTPVPLDTIRNGELPETIAAVPGTDYIVTAGSGALTFNGSSGSDTIWGGAGGETISGGTGRVVATGGAGSALILGGASGDNVLAAGTGNATLVGSSSGNHDTLYGGGPGSFSTLVGGAAGSVLTAGAGHDVLYASAGAATMFGAPAGGAATLVGGNQGSVMASGTGASTIYGGSSSDTIFGSQSGGSAAIVGGGGNDLISLGGGMDSVYASAGSDTIYMGAASQFVSTGSGNAVIVQSVASSSEDVITFGSGSSTVFGGLDPTIYMVAGSSNNLVQTDFVVDFNAQTDRIQVGTSSVADVLATEHTVAFGESIQIGGVTINFIDGTALTPQDFV